MSYNLTFLDTGETLLDATQGANTYLADGIMGALILLMVGVIVFLAYKKGDTSAAFLVSSFITSVIAVFLFAAGLVTVSVLAAPLGFLVITFFYHLASK